MRQVIWHTAKVFIIFIICTSLFYFGLRIMHAEYEQYHRYDPPGGKVVKVFNEERTFIDRLHLFLRLGE